MSLSLKNKTLIIFSGLFLVAMLVQTFYFTPSTRQRLISQSLERQERVANAVTREIETLLKSARHELEIVDELIESGPFETGRIDRILSAAEKGSYYYKTFYIIDEDGKWISFPRKPEFIGRKIPVQNMFWIKEALSTEDTLTLDVHRSRVSTSVSGFARQLTQHKVNSRRLILRGVIALGEENTLLALLRQRKMGSAGYVYVVSRDGMLLAHPNYVLPENAKLVDYSHYPPVAALIRGEQGNTTYDYEGMDWSATYKPVESVGWGIVVQQPLSDITRDADAEARRILVFSGTALLVGSLIFLLVMHLSLKPLGDLLHSIKQGKQLKEDAFTDDETGQLARRFNELFVELSRSKRDKEILLAEMHHRVKNNMQTVSSLLMLQEDAADDARVRKAFGESVSRIRAMALVHEALYKSDDFSNVDIAEYVEQLLKVYEGGPATIVNDVSHVNVSIRTAIPIGIIINELVANAMEHAFTRMGGGVIRIECSQEEDGDCRLAVSDNGSGLPEDADFKSEKSLGLFLVNLFVSQLKGEMKVERNGGTKFIITFKPEQ